MTAPQKMPFFSLYNQDNVLVKQTDFLGKKLLLFFYPKDNTSGCTKQAQAFSDQLAEFTALNTTVIGISKDSAASHQRFITRANLTITLLSDPTTEVNQAYGVWKEKSMYGKTYFGTQRTTFLLNEEGELLTRWDKVKVAGHCEAVLAYLKTQV